MGAEAAWQNRLPRRRFPLQSRGSDDRGGGGWQRSRMLLMAGGVLALAAILLARALPRAPAVRPATRTVPVVAAAGPIGFGGRLRPDQLKIVDMPVNALPRGSFQQLEPLTTGPGRTAMRPITANEILLESALATGATRLSTAPLLNPMMRALAIPVDEIAGVGGLVYPGDRVDVLMTRQPDDAQPHAELIAQNVRVLAVGPDMNIARDKPGVVKSITLELTSAQAQKLPLAVATGRISLALRHFGDDDRIRLESLQLSDLNDGTTTRLIRKPTAASSSPPPPAKAPAAPKPPPGVIVMRGGEAATVPVMP